MNAIARHRCRTALVALLFGAAASLSFAQTNKVFRCTGASGKVTLSDRRCPDDEAAAKADAKTPAVAASMPQTKVCQKDKDRQKPAAC